MELNVNCGQIRRCENAGFSKPPVGRNLWLPSSIKENDEGGAEPILTWRIGWILMN